MDMKGQMLMPWAPPTPTPQADVEAVVAMAPKAATHCTVKRAAEALGCTPMTIRNMVESGTLLAHNVNASTEARREHLRIIVRLDRPFDPTRKKFLTLEEAVRRRSNVDGVEFLTRGQDAAPTNNQQAAQPPKDQP